jgi:predicted RNase H-like nuclease (RuvC/YqgF family)
MKKHMQKLSLALLTSAAVFSGSSALGATLSDVFQAAEQMNAQAKRSQAKINDLTEETRQLLNEYKTVLKEVEGLRVYNRQLEKQIVNQEREMEQLSRSIDEVTVIERQITPLMLRMIDGLEQFVELDAPFLLGERRERVERLREMMDRADVAVSEKFSQVFRAFQIENEYGRTMETYSSTIAIDGVERKVDILKVGRIALVYQTPDGEETGMFNPTTRAYEPVDNSYQASVRQGIRMARQQASIDMLSLPVVGAGAAQ